jgi:quercetin dioxygenase-like cupin family protein
MKDHEPGHTSGSPDRPPRQVNAPVQVIRLAAEAEQVLSDREWRNADHTALTLRHTPALRQVLIAVRRDGQIAEHHAAGEVAIQVLQGAIVVGVGDERHTLGVGDLLNVAPGLPHSVAARQESVFLLTIAPVGSMGTDQ